MGDRGNIIIKTKDEQVCLYSHWGGFDIEGTLAKALRRGESRLTDFQYINRIIFCEMLAADRAGLGGGSPASALRTNHGTITTPSKSSTWTPRPSTAYRLPSS